MTGSRAPEFAKSEKVLNAYQTPRTRWSIPPTSAPRRCFPVERERLLDRRWIADVGPWRFAVKTLFITGAEGFTGSHLVPYLQGKGYEVVGGVRNRARKLAFEKTHGRALVCDVSDAINVARAIASVKPEAVIHLAGEAKPHFANAEPLEAYQSIVTAWANVLDGVRRVTPRARVLLVSACDVYGRTGDDGQLLSEDATLDPVNTFGSLKATAESLAHTFYNNYHLNVTIARPFHFTGAGQSPEFFYASVARRLANWNPGQDGDTFELPDLGCRRELLHVQDVVEGLTVLLESGRPDAVYNVCSGKALTVRQLCETLVQMAGRSVTLRDLPADSEHQVRCYCGSGARMEQEFGWRPTRSTETALDELLKSFAPQPAPVTT
ncbi:MAG: NAD-dependent epimerase/dehydratase family protein [Planctomycetota bacterium]|nr:MAG: NAD-dependent epimerase/dehydratase family protein [Planctomycetota bacterium]